MIIDSRLPDGNAFNIMGQVKTTLEAAGRADEVEAVMDRMKESDYRNLCAVAYEVSNGSIQVVGLDDDDDECEDDEDYDCST